MKQNVLPHAIRIERKAVDIWTLMSVIGASALWKTSVPSFVCLLEERLPPCGEAHIASVVWHVFSPLCLFLWTERTVDVFLLLLSLVASFYTWDETVVAVEKSQANCICWSAPVCIKSHVFVKEPSVLVKIKNSSVWCLQSWLDSGLYQGENKGWVKIMFCGPGLLKGKWFIKSPIVRSL